LSALFALLPWKGVSSLLQSAVDHAKLVANLSTLPWGTRMASSWISAVPSILKAFLEPARRLPARLRANILFELLVAALGGTAGFRGQHDAFYWTMIVMTVSWMPVILSHNEDQNAALEHAQNKATELVKPNE
jgi:hypothetical protein